MGHLASCLFPSDENGYPKPIWDKLSGEIDHDVAKYWMENYDLRYIMERDWDKMEMILRENKYLLWRHG